MKLSVVTTLYRSAATIETFVGRVVAAAQSITPDFEIVIVDDGSPDESLAIAIRLAEADPRLRIVELSRNFGHHKALMTGLMHATGAFCFLIDSDLEEDPALLIQFWARLDETAADVVYGYQMERAGDPFRRFTGEVAYRLMDALLPYRLPRNHITIRLMRRAYVDALIQHREHQVVIGGLWVITGFRQVGMAVDKGVRAETTYSFRRRLAALIDSVTSFSEVPLITIFYLGIAIFGLATLVSMFVIASRIIIGGELQGWVSVMLSVWFLGGLAILSLGILGIYIAKIFIETKNRPYTIVRQIHGGVAGRGATDENG